jgi:hypothetical protein
MFTKFIAPPPNTIWFNSIILSGLRNLAAVVFIREAERERRERKWRGSQRHYIWETGNYISCFERSQAVPTHPSGQSQSQALIWGLRPVFFLDNCGFVDVGRSLWREDGSAVYSCCWSCRIRDHILLSQIRDSPKLEGQVPVFISPRNRVWYCIGSPDMASARTA